MIDLKTLPLLSLAPLALVGGAKPDSDASVGSSSMKEFLSSGLEHKFITNIFQHQNQTLIFKNHQIYIDTGYFVVEFFESEFLETLLLLIFFSPRICFKIECLYFFFEGLIFLGLNIFLHVEFSKTEYFKSS